MVKNCSFWKFIAKMVEVAGRRRVTARFLRFLTGQQIKLKNRVTGGTGPVIKWMGGCMAYLLTYEH